LSTRERILRLVQQDPPEPGAIPRKAVSRRALYRMETESLQLDAGIRAGGATVQGRLLNVSAAGCCVRIEAAPAAPPSALDIGAAASVTLRTDAHTLVCTGEIVSLDDAGSGIEVRLRFRALAPQTQRALLAWLKTLATADFQQRHGRTISR